MFESEKILFIEVFLSSVYSIYFLKNTYKKRVHVSMNNGRE